jgi:hypothetical protein
MILNNLLQGRKIYFKLPTTIPLLSNTDSKEAAKCDVCLAACWNVWLSGNWPTILGVLTLNVSTAADDDWSADCDPTVRGRHVS